MSTSEEIIRKAYYDPSIGFTGASKLYKYLQKQGHTNISHSDIKRFLSKQEIYQRTKKNVTGQFCTTFSSIRVSN